MLTIFRIPDTDAHEPGCMHTDQEVECEDASLMYLDIFCECHRYTEPKILGNGTDIAWPAGWTENQARQWRKARGLHEPVAFVTYDEPFDSDQPRNDQSLKRASGR